MTQRPWEREVTQRVSGAYQPTTVKLLPDGGE
jgi:hypothetical protein